MKKICCTILVLTLVFINLVMVSAKIDNDDSRLVKSREMVQQYISRIEKVDVLSSDPINLYDVLTE